VGGGTVGNNRTTQIVLFFSLLNTVSVLFIHLLENIFSHEDGAGVGGDIMVIEDI